MIHCTFQVLWLTTMPTLVEVLAQFSSMTCCVLGLRQDLWTVPMMVLETMTIAIASMVMMQGCDANKVITINRNLFCSFHWCISCFYSLY